MGLDRYLTANVYIKDWSYKYENSVIPDDTPAKKVQKALGLPLAVKEVTMDAAYWRKANQIHAWFVENVQGGVDECVEHEVSRDQLASLVRVCKEVIAEPDRALDLLPTQGGFFFGSTDYDEDYLDDLRETVKQIEPLLDLPKNVVFYYRSSW